VTFTDDPDEAMEVIAQSKAANAARFSKTRKALWWLRE